MVKIRQITYHERIRRSLCSDQIQCRCSLDKDNALHLGAQPRLSTEIHLEEWLIFHRCHRSKAGNRSRFFPWRATTWHAAVEIPSPRSGRSMDFPGGWPRLAARRSIAEGLSPKVRPCGSLWPRCWSPRKCTCHCAGRRAPWRRAGWRIRPPSPRSAMRTIARRVLMVNLVTLSFWLFFFFFYLISCYAWINEMNS